jgi:phosphatidate cytidylyltransferase
MKRVLTALVLIPVAVGLIFFAPPVVVRGALALVGMLCLQEFFGLMSRIGIRPFVGAGLVAGAMLIALPTLPHPGFLVALCLLVLGTATLDSRPVEDTYSSASSTLFGVVYTCAPFALAVYLHSMSPHWIMLPLVIGWAGDSAAYYVGRAIGRRKLAPRVSPGKTWEGSIGSVVFGTAVGAAYLHLIHPIQLDLWVMIALPCVVNIAGQIGDLAESALKRGAGAKDSGTLLPGHGGVLDRMDGSLFAFPAVFLFLAILG